LQELAGFGPTLAFYLLGHDREQVMRIVDSINDSVMNEDDDGPASI
jgi:hypothetical protein